jgi:hypothetical protein
LVGGLRWRKCGDFLNAEGAKVSQRAQKDEKEYKRGEKKKRGRKKENLYLKIKNTVDMYGLKLTQNYLHCFCIFGFIFVFSFLRPLRNLRALCVQKIPLFAFR